MGEIKTPEKLGIALNNQAHATRKNEKKDKKSDKVKVKRVPRENLEKEYKTRTTRSSF